LVTDIERTEHPTASAYSPSRASTLSGQSALNSPPKITPIMWPPTTFRALAVTLLGIVNTVKAVAASDAATTRFCWRSAIRTRKTAAPAITLWRI
jgi:hypothetical protein